MPENFEGQSQELNLPKVGITQEPDAKEREKERVAKEITELSKKSIQEITENQALEILERVEVHGDSFGRTRLTVEKLKEEGLVPKYKIEIGGAVVWLSSCPYDLNNGRIAVVGYVQTDKEKVMARSYYRSNSTGLWRYLPNYTVSEDGNINWYDKGHGEESITLPAVLQHALSEISKEGSEIKVVKNPDLILAGTARESIRKDEGTYIGEIQSRPERLSGNFYSNDFDEKVPPELMDFKNEGQAPDFEKIITNWKQNTGLYGEITIEFFSSKDGKLTYMFCLDGTGRAWIGGIESNGDIQSTGLKQRWVSGGDLITPAYEYHIQDGGYGNHNLMSGKHEEYTDMFENYLSKIPVIQNYLSLRHPEISMQSQEKLDAKKKNKEASIKKLSRGEFGTAVLLLLDLGDVRKGSDAEKKILKKFEGLGVDPKVFARHINKALKKSLEKKEGGK